MSLRWSHGRKSWLIFSRPSGVSSEFDLWTFHHVHRRFWQVQQAISLGQRKQPIQNPSRSYIYLLNELGYEKIQNGILPNLYSYDNISSGDVV